jgi:hypothetical protein
VNLPSDHEFQALIPWCDGMVMAAFLNARYMNATTRNGQHSFHQDLIAR